MTKSKKAKDQPLGWSFVYDEIASAYWTKYVDSLF